MSFLSHDNSPFDPLIFRERGAIINRADPLLTRRRTIQKEQRLPTPPPGRDHFSFGRLQFDGTIRGKSPLTTHTAISRPIVDDSVKPIIQQPLAPLVRPQQYGFKGVLIKERLTPERLARGRREKEEMAQLYAQQTEELKRRRTLDKLERTQPDMWLLEKYHTDDRKRPQVPKAIIPRDMTALYLQQQDAKWIMRE
jgi:hypothetical protein